MKNVIEYLKKTEMDADDYNLIKNIHKKMELIIKIELQISFN